MATTPEKIVTPSKALSENLEKNTGSSSSEPEINRARVSGDSENPVDESESHDGETASNGSQSNDCLVNDGGETLLFRAGDFVWGESKGRPHWFPGRVQDPESADGVLVAFYDGSCSLCSPAQLAPFTENFSVMSKAGSSKGFRKAVGRAIDELSRVLELELTCKCVAKEKEDRVLELELVSEMVGGFDRLSIPKYEPPVELLEKLREFAKGDYSRGVLEVAVLKSRLAAFYYSKGGFLLPVYGDPVRIEGLEDEDGARVSGGVKSDFSVRNTGPMQDDKVSRKRKEKSVAELIGEEVADFKDHKRKNNNVESEGLSNQGSSLTGRKRKAEKIAGPALEKHREIEIEVLDAEDINGVANEDLMTVSTPRERRKSKYLSPPYTNLTSRILGKSSVKTESRIEEKLPNVPLKDPNIHVNELLLELQFAAVDPFYLFEKGSSDTVEAFTSALRSSTFLHGADYKMYHKGTSEENVKVETLPQCLIPVATEELDSSHSADELISDASLMGQKVEIMTAILEDNYSKFSAEDKSRLKDDMKVLRERVERVWQRVRAMAEER